MFLDEFHENFQSIEAFKTSGRFIDPFIFAFSDLCFNEIY